MERLRSLWGPKEAKSFQDLKPHTFLEVVSPEQEGWAYVGPEGVYVRRKQGSVFVRHAPDDPSLYPVKVRTLAPDQAFYLFHDLLLKHMVTMPAHSGSVA